MAAPALALLRFVQFCYLLPILPARAACWRLSTGPPLNTCSLCRWLADAADSAEAKDAMVEAQQAYGAEIPAGGEGLEQDMAALAVEAQ